MNTLVVSQLLTTWGRQRQRRKGLNGLCALGLHIAFSGLALKPDKIHGPVLDALLYSEKPTVRVLFLSRSVKSDFLSKTQKNLDCLEVFPRQQAENTSKSRSVEKPKSSSRPFDLRWRAAPWT